MSKQRIYYPKTTYSQRRLLFQVWEETKNMKAACRQARVSVNTFYYWKPRFETDGYEALKEFKKPGPAKGMWISEEIKEKVREMKQAQPQWGRRRIADELTKANSWVPVVSANTVKQILIEAGLWEMVIQAGKKRNSDHQVEQLKKQGKRLM